MAHAPEQRGPRTPLHQDITEEMIENLVNGFYGKVRADETLGPIFNDVIKDNWPDHLARMCIFWGAIMLKTGAYKGRPVPKHMAISKLQPDHFKIWLALFRKTAKEICGPEIGAIFIDKAEAIAESLQMACFFNGALAPRNAFKNGEYQNGPR